MLPKKYRIQLHKIKFKMNINLTKNEIKIIDVFINNEKNKSNEYESENLESWFVLKKYIYDVFENYLG